MQSSLYTISDHILKNKNEVLAIVHKYDIHNPLRYLAKDEYEESCYDELVHYLINDAGFQFDLVVFYLTKEHVKAVLGMDWYLEEYN